MIEFETCVATHSWVNREYRRGLSIHPWSHHVGDQHGGGIAAYIHHLGLARQEVQDPVAQGGVQSQGPEYYRAIVI